MRFAAALALEVKLLRGGTSGARRAVGRSTRRNIAAMAAIQVPGATEAVGMGAGALFGPAVGAAAYGAARIAGMAATGAIAKRLMRRRKLGKYLDRRMKRGRGYR